MCWGVFYLRKLLNAEDTKCADGLKKGKNFVRVYEAIIYEENVWDDSHFKSALVSVPGTDPADQ
jgi:hypothetical protein